MCLTILEGLDMIIDSNRNHASFARDIPTNHQHHAKFTKGMRKTQHTTR